MAEKPPRRRRVTIEKTGRDGVKASIELPQDDPTKPTDTRSVHDFLNQALSRFRMASEAETYNRTEGAIDVRMADPSGEGQWDPDIRGTRKAEARPCLVINRFVPMIAHVGNEQRQSRPSIQIDPVGGGADPDTAAILQGLIRHIEVDSTAETVYDTAFERMIEKGWSWFRVISEWEGPESFNQILKIEGFSNDFLVYCDPTAVEPTRKDMKWAFVIQDMPLGEYATEYPKSSIQASLTQMSSVGDNAAGWYGNDYVRVAEYYYVEDTPATIVRMLDGSGRYEDELKPEEMAMRALDEKGQPETRQSYRRTVKWAKINALEILDGNMGKDVQANTEGRDMKCTFIPLIHVAGRETVVDGKRRLAGMVRNNRDAQRIYNYMISAFVEMVALAPKSPFIAAIGQIEDFKNIWDSANTKNWPYLPYKAISADGQNVPPPQRTEFNPQIGAVMAGVQQMDNDLKVGFNIFDPSVGKRGSDESGKAIQLLQRKSDSGNMNWLDNFRRSQVHCANVLLDQIPTRYDAARVITIVRPDNQREEVLINRQFPKTVNGVVQGSMQYDLTKGKYAVTVSIGEYATKRQEAVASLIEVSKNSNPQVALALTPLILDNMDTPMAKEAAAVVRRLLPPEAQEPGSPEQLQAQVQALLQQHQQLMQITQKLQGELESRNADKASKEFIAGMQEQTKAAIAAAKLGSQEGMAALQFELSRITKFLELAHDRIIQENQIDHEKDLHTTPPAAQPGAPA